MAVAKHENPYVARHFVCHVVGLCRSKQLEYIMDVGKHQVHAWRGPLRAMKSACAGPPGFSTRAGGEQGFYSSDAGPVC